MHNRNLFFALIACCALAFSACDSSTESKETDQTLADTEADQEVTTTDQSETDVDAVEDVVDECGGCPGVTACVDGACAYDASVVDVCEPGCRGDIERCMAGECVFDDTRACYLDVHCTDGSECEGADPELAQTGLCTYNPEPLRVCPGSEGCETATGTLKAGAGKRAITTACGDCGTGFELPNLDFVRDDSVWEGSVFETDSFHDCGRDQICPGDDGYPGPDPGEGDGYFQGAWIAGFDHGRPALGIRDDIWARAVVLEQGDVKVALVSVDLVGYFYNDIQEVRRRLPAELGIDKVVVSATHSHEAPDALGQWGPGDIDGELPASSGRDPEHVETMIDGIVAAIEDAANSTVEVEVKVAETRTGAALLHDSRDPVIINDTLTTVLLNDASSGENVASLINWHSHPESLWDENQYISSDFPHHIRDAFENGLEAKTDATEDPAIEYPERAGLGGVSIYFSGTVGGLIGPSNVSVRDRDGVVYTERGDNERTRAMGEVVAEQAFVSLDSAETLTDINLTVASVEKLIPVANTQFHTAIFGLKLFQRPFYNFEPGQQISATNVPHGLTEFVVVSLGELTFYTVPGELFSESAIGGYDGSYSHGRDIIDDPDAPFPPNLDDAPKGPYLNEQMPGKYAFVLGLGQDELGYIVPEYNYVLDDSGPYIVEADGDHYEETNSVGPVIEPLVMGSLAELLDALAK